MGILFICYVNRPIKSNECIHMNIIIDSVGLCFRYNFVIGIRQNGYRFSAYDGCVLCASHHTFWSRAQAALQENAAITSVVYWGTQRAIAVCQTTFARPLQPQKHTARSITKESKYAAARMINDRADRAICYERHHNNTARPVCGSVAVDNAEHSLQQQQSHATACVLAMR